MSLYASFPSSLFIPCASSSQIPPHDTSRTLISTSGFLRKYFHTQKYGGVLAYPTQDYICKIPSRKSQNRFTENLPVQSLPLFLYTHYFELQLKHYHWTLNNVLG